MVIELILTGHGVLSEIMFLYGRRESHKINCKNDCNKHGGFSRSWIISGMEHAEHNVN